MATTLTNPSLAVSAKAQLQSGAQPALVSSQVNHSPAISVGAGISAGNVNLCFSQAFTVTSGSPLTINVATGLDPLGNALAMAHVCAVLVENDSTTTGQDFTVGAGTHPVLGSDQFTAQANGGVGFVCNPGAGYAVTAGSADTLTITVAAGTSVPGKVTILGRSA